MDALETKSVVRRLHNGECPRCGGQLSFMSDVFTFGELEKNGMAKTCEVLKDEHGVFCKTCKYKQEAIQIGLKLVPVDRIFEYDINWDVQYLEDNTLINGEEGKNPFYKKDKE